MLVTPVAQRGMDVALPDPDGPHPPPNPQPVVLSIDDAGELSVNRRPVPSEAELMALLRDTFQTRADKTLFFEASGANPYGRVVAALDVARGAGVERIGLLSANVAAPPTAQWVERLSGAPPLPLQIPPRRPSGAQWCLARAEGRARPEPQQHH
jgi:biopolymer transport protein ExbD